MQKRGSQSSHSSRKQNEETSCKGQVDAGPWENVGGHQPQAKKVQHCGRLQAFGEQRHLCLVIRQLRLQEVSQASAAESSCSAKKERQPKGEPSYTVRRERQ